MQVLDHSPRLHNAEPRFSVSRRELRYVRGFSFNGSSRWQSYNDLLIASARHARTASPHAPKHDELSSACFAATASTDAAEMAHGRNFRATGPAKP
jgi:hypothetical protein